MIFSETILAGAYTVEIDRHQDNRGYFARVFCADTFLAHGLKPVVAQASISYNAKRGTLRGLHFQYPPATENKYVRCTKGAVADVIVDLRPESATYLRHVIVNLSADNGRGLYIPERFAHGFITLEPNTEALYLVDEFYASEFERGVRWNDPKFGVRWPTEPSVISDKDAKARDFDPNWHLHSQSSGAAI